MLFFASAEDHDLSLVLSCLGAEHRSDQRNLTCKFGVKYFVLCFCIGKDKRRLFDLINEVEHRNTGASSHERIITSLMTAIRLHILLHILIIDVRVGLQQFLVEAGLVERLQVHFYGFKRFWIRREMTLVSKMKGKNLFILSVNC